MKRLKQRRSELNFSKNFAQETINWVRWQLFEDLKASKARPSMVFFIITNFIYVVVKKIRRYFNFSLKSILFLSLITANFASLEKPRSCLTLTYCVSKHLWRSDVLSVKIKWIISFLWMSLFHRCFSTYFTDANHLPDFSEVEDWLQIS